jgi:hypothetical protein
VVKLDVGALDALLENTGRRRGYIRPMPTFTLAGVSYDYLAPKVEGDPEEVHSWEYGQWPRVEAAVPLKAGGTVTVYGEAMRWGHEQIIVRWLDDEEHAHIAWIPKDNVRRLTAVGVGHHRLPPMPARTPINPVGEAGFPARIG